MYLVDQKPWSIHLTALPKLFVNIFEKFIRGYEQRKQNAILKRLSDHQLKDIGFTQSDIYILKHDGNWIDPLSAELRRVTR